jgi:hypothetical protein
MLFKDLILDALAEHGNVAQFVSFGPHGEARFSRVAGFPPNHKFLSPSQGIETLLKKCRSGTVNVRTFVPERPKGEPLVADLKLDGALSVLASNRESGKYSIINETIPITDGGVSGVLLGNIIEFAPWSTPKCVEKPGVCSLPVGLGKRMLSLVYGFDLDLNYDPNVRVEFSVHPIRQGLSNQHVILWEREEFLHFDFPAPRPWWPNKFSELLGNKVFGLVVADLLGLRIPRTTVVAKHVAPFSFGKSTGTGEFWYRTCPSIRYPGKYLTTFGWTDPFAAVPREEAQNCDDAHFHPVASVISQESVPFEYSGSLVPNSMDEIILEGVRGAGDEVMVGRTGPQPLPDEVEQKVSELYRGAVLPLLGPCELEWVFDGKNVWIVQIHPVADFKTKRDVDDKDWIPFEVAKGLEALRQFLLRFRAGRKGIVLLGDVGYTSHFGDLLREAGIPFRIVKNVAN